MSDLATPAALIEHIKGLPPAEALQFIRRWRAQHSFSFFVNTYFEEYTRYEPALCHADFLTIGERIMFGDGGAHEAIAAPRGSAKSTYFSLFLPLWAICTGRKHFVVIVSDTEDQATSLMKMLRKEIEDNEKLKEDFGDLRGDEWGATQIVTSNGTMVLALGSKQKIRGRRHGAWRPDLLILDDLENDKNSQSADMRRELAAWVDEAVSYCGDRYTDVIFVGTLLHQESVLALKLKNPLWRHHFYRAVINWATNKALWNEWEAILINLEEEDHENQAYAFYEQHRAAMLEGTEVLWPSKEPYIILMLQLVGDGPAAFQKERQNNPINPEECPFDPSWFQYYTTVGEELDIYGFVDPSMGEKETSDYSAIIIVGVGKRTGIRYVLSADIKRRTPTVLIDDIIMYYGYYSFTRFGGEANGMQKYWLSQLTEAMRNKGLTPLPEAINHTGNKVARIKSLQPAIKNGTMKFYAKGQDLLVQQLTYFPLAAHDDGPDALEAAEELTRFGGQLVFGSL